mgnify:FL=1
MARIIGEVQPRFALLENSQFLVFRGLDKVLGDLAEMGYDARWGVFSAADVGARHCRPRIWIIAGHWNAIENTAITERCFYAPDEKSLRIMSEGISAEPGMGRKTDGLAHWMDRLESIGNGQVPGVAALAWRLLGGE